MPQDVNAEPTVSRPTSHRRWWQFWKRETRRVGDTPPPGKDGAPSSSIWVLSDEPTTENLLEDFERLRDSLVSVITDLPREKMPLTIGLHGGWGSGKTSLLLMVQETLHERAKQEQKEKPRADPAPRWIAPVFSAWKYRGEEDTWAALLQAILRQVRQELGWIDRIEVRWKIWWRRIDWDGIGETLIGWGIGQLLPHALAAFLVVLALLLLPVWVLVRSLVNAAGGWLLALGISTTAFSSLAAFGILRHLYTSLVQSARNDLGLDLSRIARRPFFRSRVAALDDVGQDFTALTQAVRELTDHPLVIMIDDLDRCAPDRIVSVLEAIKLFMHSRRDADSVSGDQPIPSTQCVFLLAMDRRTVEKAVEIHYEKLNKEEKFIKGKDYLEKIVQFAIDIPPIVSSSGRSEARATAVEEYITSLILEGSFPHGARQVVEDHCALLSRGLMPTTPRQVKRILNTFLANYDIWFEPLAPAQGRQPPPLPLDPCLLAKMAVIQYKWSDLYGELAEHPSLLADLEEFFDWPRLPDLTKPFPAGSPAGTHALVEQYGRDQALADLLTPDSEGTESCFKGINIADYLLAATDRPPIGPARIWEYLLSGDLTKVKAAKEAVASEGQRDYLVNQLRAIVREPGSDKRKEALYALETLDSAGWSYSDIMAVLKQPDAPSQIRFYALHALGQIVHRGVRITNKLVSLLLYLVEDSSLSPRIRGLAADVTWHLGERRDAQSVLEADNAKLFKCLLECLGKTHGEGPLLRRLWFRLWPSLQNLFTEPWAWSEFVRFILARDPESAVVREASQWMARAWPLSKDKFRETVQALLEAVKGFQGQPRAVELLKGQFFTLLQTDALQEIGIEILRDAVREEELGEVRAVVVEALGQVGDDPIVPDLEGALDDASVSVCQAAAWALANLGTDQALQVLRQRGLGHTDPGVRSIASVALGPEIPEP